MSALGSAGRPYASGMTRTGGAAQRARIVQVIPSFRVGGLENIAVRLVKHLDPLADQVLGQLGDRAAAGGHVPHLADSPARTAAHPHAHLP